MHDWYDFGPDFSEAAKIQSFQLDENDLTMMESLIDSITRHYFQNLLSIKLVGSRARGTHRPDSDWDVLVMLQHCDYDIDLPFLGELSQELEKRFNVAEISLSPLDENKFESLDNKYEGITDQFRADALTLYSKMGGRSAFDLSLGHD